MLRLISRLAWFCLGVGIGAMQAKTPTGVIQRLPGKTAGGEAIAVRVEDRPLVFTGQVAAAELTASARNQAEAALRALGQTLALAGADLDDVVRLNACVATDAAAREVRAAIAARFADAPVALTLLRSPPSAEGALVMFDAIAVASSMGDRVKVLGPAAAVMPEGGKIFISGQAERGRDLAESVRLTLAGLNRTLTHLGLSAADVVQARAFLRPFSERAAAQREFAASFGDQPAPPLVVMEWLSDLFVEIELVVALPSSAPKPVDPIGWAALPWLNKSPRYSHVCTIAGGTPLIFIGAIDGDAGEPRAQMKRIFERIGSALFDAGSSYRHLAKATYFLGDPAARSLLGDIRGVYYDPARAPAASALEVSGFDVPGRAALIDLIAVPAK